MNPTTTSSRRTLSSLLKGGDLFFVMALLGTIVLLVLPVPAFALDLFLAASIGISLLMLLIIIYVKDPPEFSGFPTLLLSVTLFRLALNVASTRLILVDGHAGHIIDAFGHFVIRGNYVVGAVVFLILIVINFMVVTKGAGRIAEVAARFTLDAMPGKQMAIDAELNAGIIDEQMATTRRSKIQKEAEFYGAMDGASKFVRGDAVAGILIVLINVLGGFAIGIVQKGLPVMEALQKYTLLSIGDGLVAQVPALIVSVAAGILVTRASENSNLGAHISKQLTLYPRAIAISSAMMFGFALMPGMPMVPFIALGALAAFVARKLKKSAAETEAAAFPATATTKPAGAAASSDETKPAGDEMRSLIEVEVFSIELGYGLIQMADRTRGGDLLDRVTGVRKAIARELGMIVPPIALRDNFELEPNEYRFLLRNKPVARGQLMSNRWLAMDVGNNRLELPGIPAVEPVFGLKATWIADEQKQSAEMNGCTVVDPASVLITHLSESLKRHAHLILARQDVQTLIDHVKEKNQTLVAELIPDLVNIGIVQRVLQNLLKEGISIKNLPVIMECIADFAPLSKNPEDLAEQARRRLGVYFVGEYESEPGLIKAITLDPRLEQLLISKIHRTPFEIGLMIDPQLAQHLLGELTRRMSAMSEQGLTPILMTTADLRLAFKRFFEASLQKLVVLSYQEMPAQTEIQSFGIVQPALPERAAA